MKMRMAVAAAATVACLVFIAGAAYGVLMMEWFAPVSDARLGYAAALNYSIKTADLNALDAQAKAVHGPDASALYNSDEGAAVRNGNGATSPASIPRQISSIYGLFTITQGSAVARFPYSIVPDFLERSHREPVTHDRLKRFHARAPGYFAYTDRDWTLLGCETLMTPGTGISAVDVQLQLGSSDICLIRWLKEPQATMAVGGVAAEGGPWIRHFVTPLCRTMAKGWLSALNAEGRQVDYIACGLIFDPSRPVGGPRDVMDRRVYQVTDTGRLAVVR